MFDLITMGELLVDFTSIGKSENGMNIFEQNAGGAVANAVSAFCRLGGKGAYIGKVGRDMHGEFLLNALKQADVDTSYAVIDENYFTTLAFVALNNGERSFSFARKPGADTQLKTNEVNLECLKDAKIFHIGSLSLTDEPSRSTTLDMLAYAKENGCIISYDPNYRAPLWKSVEEAKQQMRSVLEYVDIMKLSDEETYLLCDEEDIIAAGEKLIQKGIKIVNITCGAKGAYSFTNKGHIITPALKIDAVDTTGAGDAFTGGFLYAFNNQNANLVNTTLQDISSFAEFASKVAGLCVQKRGGIPSMPTLEEVNNIK